MGVGCRDKTFVLFDLSTTVAVKVFHTPSWVTSICWTCDAYVAIRSETRCISLLDLSPIQHSSLSHPFGKQGGNCGGSLSWSSNGQYLACSVGSRVSIVDSSLISDDNKEFRSVASFDMTAGGLISQVVFCQAAAKADLVAVIDDSGSLVILRLCVSSGMTAALNVESTVFVEPFLKSLAWSNDGKMLATGGRSKRLHLFSLEKSTLKATKQLELTGRIWDVDFVPSNLHDIGPTPLLLAVALGDYTTVLLDFAFDVKLQISRSLTCRCLKFHPVARVLAIGDGAGMIAVVDYDAGELLMEWDAGGRVNKMEYSPIGDFLIVGTDSCLFSLFESTHYQCVQEMSSHGFALCASFSPNGLHLALGSEKCSYLLIRLGPFLGTDYVPLQLANHPGPFPSWSKESLYRSCNGPSFLQRNMIHGGSDNLRRVSKILLEHPDSIYTFNRASGEGCFDTAMRLQKPGLVKLVVTSLVNGTLNPPNDKEKNFLTTSIPESGRKSLKDIVENYPQDYIVDILQAMVFTKVPFTAPRVVESGERIECGSPLYTDPWIETGAERRQLARSRTSSKLVLRGGSIRTPAVLPVPGLGNIDFLSSLLRVSRADVFDNDAMAVVLRVLWRHHIRKFYYIDCCFFASFYLSWIVFLELVTTSEITNTMNPRTTPTLALVIISLNTMFAAKEVIEAIATKLSVYFGSLWNFCDLVAIASVYAYTLEIFVTGNSHVPLAVCTTLFLTLKLLSYLRGFSSTGWLLSVLGANFRDVRGFLVILGIILAGFSVIFRVLFGATGDESFGSLRRSFLSTFELTVTGTYDTNLLFETQYTFLVVISFVLAITCVLVVALNALISILGESYAKVQQHAVANRRRELASLIVEYMCLLPTWKRRQIEHSVTWFHTLLEVDEDGSLHIETGGGEGGMSALCRDMEELSRLNAQSLEKSLEHLKADINAEMTKFKEELVAKLEDLTDDVKHVRKLQSEGILKFDAKQSVAKVVKAVQLIGRKGRITMIKHDDDD